MTQPGSSQARYLITLVHGTFAKGAAWTLPGSQLASALVQGLGDAAVLQRFDWSGRNTHRARLRAGHELAAFLDATAAEHPGAKSVVITHSHGGNVALYAARHARPASISDIVFMATPFIRCRPRGRASLLTHVARILVSIAVAVPFAAMLGSAYYYYGQPLLKAHGTELGPKLATVLDQVIHWGSFLLVIAIAYALVGWWLRRSSGRLAAALAWPAASNLNALTVYYRHDEAKDFLSYLDFGTARVARLIWKLIAAAIVGWIVYFAATLLVRAYYPDIYATSLFSAEKMWWGEGGGPPQRGPWFEIALYILAAWVPLMMLIAYALPVLRGHPWGYGWELPSSTAMLDIDVAAEPEGLKLATSEVFATDVDPAQRHKGFAHCYVYEDPRVLQKIVAWIRR